MGNSEKTKIRIRSFCEKVPRSNYPKYGWLHETLIRAKPNYFILHVGTNELNSNRPPDEIAKTIIDIASELKSEKSDDSKKIKASHLNSTRLHLNRKGANILNSSLTYHISKVFNWQLSGDTSCCNVSESDFEKNESGQKKITKVF